MLMQIIPIISKAILGLIIALTFFLIPKLTSSNISPRTMARIQFFGGALGTAIAFALGVYGIHIMKVAEPVGGIIGVTGGMIFWLSAPRMITGWRNFNCKSGT